MHGLGRIDKACPACGLDLTKLERADGPAVFLIFILGAVVTPMAIFVGMATDWPMWLHALIWSVVVLAGTLGLLAPAQSLVMHIQYRQQPELFK
ncbi:MAG: DUF983 domain-containing protein [Bdellovibrionales bacterium]